MWFAKAAKQGDPEAQYKLGLMYRDGLGVTQNKSESRRWLRKAANNGHGEAKQALDEL